MKNKGITLIALVVTVVVLLILAGISIGALNGENGIIGQAKEGKDSAEISEEKEIIEVSSVQAMEKDKFGNLEKNNLQEKLNANTGDGKTEVIDSGDKLVAKFIEKNRYYEIDKDGNVDGPKELIKDTNPGDVTKDSTGKDLAGTEDEPFQINCIEDLVTFSIMVNGGNAELGIASNQFKSQYVVLMRTLDFQSIFSYDDHSTTTYGDLNKDGVIEDIYTELTKTAEGCVGFTPIGYNGNNGNVIFNGTFDGQEYEIRNIYENFDENYTNIHAGLFGKANKEIKNITIRGTIINDKWIAAGICAGGGAKITNCKNYANVTGYNMAGGIGALNTNGIIVDSCINYGTIKVTGHSYDYGAAGGIVGSAASCIIQNCTNEGNVIDVDTRAGGILGRTYRSGTNTTCNIYNCINKGETRSGILGGTVGEIINIISCCNLGECTNGIMSSFSGADWNGNMKMNLQNCYNIGKVSNSGILGKQGTVCSEITLNIENCYNAGTSNKAIIGSIATDSRTTTVTNITNAYYDTTKSTSVGAYTEGITGLSIQNNTGLVETLNNNIGDNTEWKCWKMGENGYPTFE